MSLVTGMDTVHPASIVSMFGQAYWGNGFDPVKVWDGFTAAANNAGYPEYTGTPSTGDGAAGNVTAGAHNVRCRYMNQVAGYVGDPSPIVAHTAAGAKILGVTVAASTDAKVDTIVVEMTTVGGSVYYEAGRFPNSTGTASANRADTTLAEYTMDWDNLGHIAPPVGGILLEHRGCLVVAGPVVSAEGYASVATTAVAGSGSNFRAVMAADNWFMLFSGDTAASEIASFGSATALKLTRSHSTVSKRGYKAWSPYQNYAFASKPLFPESMGDDDGVIQGQELLQNRHDTLKAVKSYFGALIVYGESNMERLDWEASWDDRRIYPIPGNRGACNQRVVVDIEGTLYAFDRKGVHRYRGGVPEGISRPVDNLLANVAWAYQNKFHAHFDPDERQYVVFVCDGAETEPKTAYCYDVDRGVWSTRQYDVGITASGLVPDSNGVLRPLLGDQNGHTWFAGLGNTDGAHPTCTSILTAATGTTAATLTVAATDVLYTSGQGVKGCSLYWESGDEIRYASTNTTTKVILASAFGSIPAVGDSVYLGRIYSRLKTKAFSLKGEEYQNQPIYLHVNFTPLSSAKYMYVRIYEDFSATAKSDWATYSEGQAGVGFTAADPEIRIDLSTANGHVKVPISSSWGKHVEFEFRVYDGGFQPELFSYFIEGFVEDEEVVK